MKNDVKVEKGRTDSAEKYRKTLRKILRKKGKVKKGKESWKLRKWMNEIQKKEYIWQRK